MIFQKFLSNISIYGLLASAGILAVCLWLYVYEHRHPQLAGDIDLAGVYSLIGAITGAKILYLATVWPFMIEDLPYLTCIPDLFFKKYLYAGFVYYGGAIGFLSVSYLYARCNHIPYSDIASPLVPALALFHVFGRLGCFFQGCCYGVPTQRGFAVIYQHSEIAPNDIPLFPVQLVEAGAEAAIFILLLHYLKKKVRGSVLAAIYLLSYGVLRFVLEFFRDDSYRGMLYGLSLSQYISILGIVAGSVIVLASRRHASSADYN